MMDAQERIVEYPTAGQRIAIERQYFAYESLSLTEIIQKQADEGYNYCGKIDEYQSTGISLSYADHLFIKAVE